MSEPDPKTTLREFREYVASSHESHSKIAGRIGVSQWAIWNWLTGKQPPAAKSLVRLRAFLDAEAKRALQGDGIRPLNRYHTKSSNPFSKCNTLDFVRSAEKGAGRDPQTRCWLVSGRLPEVWSERTDARRTPKALRAWNGREFRDGTGALWGGGRALMPKSRIRHSKASIPMAGF